MNIEELIKAIKEINPDAKTTGLKKAELEALLAQLKAALVNHSENPKAAADETPADQEADISSDAEKDNAVANEKPVLVNNSGDLVNNSGDLVNNGAELVSAGENQQAAADQADNVPRETSPEDLIKNNIADAALTPAFYVVAEGKAITSKRGILPAGEAVEARDFVGGEDTLKSLLERGLIQ